MRWHHSRLSGGSTFWAASSLPLSSCLPKMCPRPGRCFSPLSSAAKRLAIIDDSEDDSEEASGPRRRRGRSGSGSRSGSEEEEGSEGEESGLASDLSGDDSHDMEGEWAAERRLLRACWLAVCAGDDLAGRGWVCCGLGQSGMPGRK